mmetsp:Transcript_9140/g.33529  ORF Transcript_9140/g.33529 Transcript_9140/m.33529 type:complete len:241 (-) Transcript_9140:358-1080(-)
MLTVREVLYRSPSIQGSVWMSRKMCLRLPSSILPLSFWLRPPRFFWLKSSCPMRPERNPCVKSEGQVPKPALRSEVRFSVTLSVRSISEEFSLACEGIMLTSSEHSIICTRVMSRCPVTREYTLPGRVRTLRRMTGSLVRPGTGLPVSRSRNLTCTLRTMPSSTSTDSVSPTNSTAVPSPRCTCPNSPRSMYHWSMSCTVLRTSKRLRLVIWPWCSFSTRCSSLGGISVAPYTTTFFMTG